MGPSARTATCHDIQTLSPLLWVVASVLEAVEGFRRLKGCCDMLRFVAALRARDHQLGLGASVVNVRRISSEPPPNFNSGRDITLFR